MSLSRRQFLVGAAGSGLALGLARIPLTGAPFSRKPLVAGNPLRIPPLFSGDSITAAFGTQSVWNGAATEIFTYGGGYPSPTIVARSGDTFSVRLHNSLTEVTNIHWHGLIIPPAMDGHPSKVVSPSAAFDYSFKIQQRAGTYWYHPHPHMATGRQVYKGMAGFFIVHDDEEESLGLPAGEFDVPLLLQDRRLEGDNSFKYEVMEEDLAEGYIGDVVLVNGTPEAYLEVGRGLYRFRILNGSNARIFDLTLSDGKPFHIIGTDGGLLDKPYEVTFAYLASAERIEILMDFSQYQIGESVTLRSLPFSGETGRKQGSAVEVITFNITREGNALTVPSTLASLEKLDPAQAVRTRLFELRIDHGSDPEGHTINNLRFDMMRIDEQVRLGDLEIWTFKNISFNHHPMHLHGAQFQVLDRNGNANLAPTDLGWKDTVYVRPYQTVRVLVRFSPHAGVYLVHCHNLEHEDVGMMLNFEMAAELGVEDADALPTRLDLR